MEKVELNLISFWVSFLLLRGINFPSANDGLIIPILATISLALYYLGKSPSVLQAHNKKQKIIAGITGTGIFFSLISLPFNIFLYPVKWLDFLPILNIGVTASIIVYLILTRVRKNSVPAFYKNIFFRSTSVLIITCFFAYMTPKSAIFRKVVIYLNAGRDDMISNMKAFGFLAKTEESIDNGNCDKAINYSQKGVNEGLKWLCVDNKPLDKHILSQFWKLQLLIYNSYKAYNCKAEALYDNHNFRDAIYNYKKSDSTLIIYAKTNRIGSNLNKERAEVYNEIGLSFNSLGKYDSAAQYFYKAIKLHSDSIKTINGNLEAYFSNLAYSVANLRYWKESNSFARQFLFLLSKDSVSSEKEKSDNYSRIYLQLIFNSLGQNRIDLARKYFDSLSVPYGKLKCKYYLLRSVLSVKENNYGKILNYADSSCHCYIQNYDPSFQNVASSYLLKCHAWLEIPNYDSAWFYIKKGEKTTLRNYPYNSRKYYSYLEYEACYYYEIGNYNTAFRLFQKIRGAYEKKFLIDDERLISVLSKIGLIYNNNANYEKAKLISNRAFNIANQRKFLDNSSTSGLLNELAYLKLISGETLIADSLYKKSLSLNLNEVKTPNINYSEAINGMALVAMKNEELQEADSLFDKAIQSYQTQFPNGHPNLGITLMNKSKLYLEKGFLNKSLKLIDQALSNFKKFHRERHPIVGDMVTLKAQILLQEGEKIKAIDFFKKALKIYEFSFQEENPKISDLKEVLKTLN